MNAPAPISRRLIVVEIDDNAEAIVTAPYAARPIIKALWFPLRRWDPQRRRWIVGRSAIRSLVADLRANGYEVDVWRDGRMTTLKPTGERPVKP